MEGEGREVPSRWLRKRRGGRGFLQVVEKEEGRRGSLQVVIFSAFNGMMIQMYCMQNAIVTCDIKLQTDVHKTGTRN